jgi:hypothetical protein
MSEFARPLTSRDREWIEYRERLARAARELHFSAISDGAANGPMLLVIAGNLAGLALSIPMPPATEQDTSGRDMTGGLVSAYTLFATQILHRAMQPNGDATGDGETWAAGARR